MFTADGVLTIYSLGDSIFLSNVLNGIAMITTGGDSADDRGSFLYITAIGAMFGFILTALRGLQTGKAFDLNSLMLCIIAWYFFFGWNVTVGIRDVFHNEDRLVAHVPGGVALTGSAISSLGWGLTSIYEQAFMPVTAEGGIAKGLSEGAAFADTAKTLNTLTALGGNPALLTALDSGKPGNPGKRVGMRENIVNYINECTMTAVDLGYKNLSDVFRMSVVPDSSSSSGSGNGPVSENSALSFSNGGNVYMTTYDGDTYNCDTALGKMNADIDSALKRTAAGGVIATMVNTTAESPAGGTSRALASSDPAGQESISRAFQKIDGIMGMLGKDSETAQNMMKASIYYHLFPLGAASNALAAGDRATATMLEQARLQRNTQWSSEGTMFQQTMLPIMTFIEGFTYAVTPFMGLFLLLGMFGVSLSIKYFMLVAWVQSWMPCLAIANNYIDSSIQRALSGLGTNAANNVITGRLDSFTAVMHVMDVAQNHIATAGMFIGAIPIITLFIFSGSIYALSSLTSRMNGAEFINQKIATPDMLSPAAVMSGMSQMTTQQGAAIQNGASFASIKISSMAGLNLARSQQALHNAQVGMSASSGKAFDMLYGLSNGHTDQYIWQNSGSSDYTKGLGVSNALTNSLKETFGDSASEQDISRIATEWKASGSVDAVELLSSLVGGGANLVSKGANGLTKLTAKGKQVRGDLAKAAEGGNSFADKILKGLDASVGVSSTNGESSALTLSSVTSDMQGIDHSYVSSGQFSSDYKKAVNAALNNSDAISRTNGESAKIADQYQKQASILESTQDSYTKQSNIARTSGVEQSISTQQILNAVNGGNTTLSNVLNGLYNNLDDDEKEAIDKSAEAMVNSNMIGDKEDARLVATATHLTSDNAENSETNRLLIGAAYSNSDQDLIKFDEYGRPTIQGLEKAANAGKTAQAMIGGTQAKVDANVENEKKKTKNVVKDPNELDKKFNQGLTKVQDTTKTNNNKVADQGKEQVLSSAKPMETVKKGINNFDKDASKSTNLLNLFGRLENVYEKKFGDGFFDNNGLEIHKGDSSVGENPRYNYKNINEYDALVEHKADDIVSDVTQRLEFTDSTGNHVESEQSIATRNLLVAATKSAHYGVLNKKWDMMLDAHGIQPSEVEKVSKANSTKLSAAKEEYKRTHPGMTDKEVNNIIGNYTFYLDKGLKKEVFMDSLYQADIRGAADSQKK